MEQLQLEMASHLALVVVAVEADLGWEENHYRTAQRHVPAMHQANKDKPLRYVLDVEQAKADQEYTQRIPPRRIQNKRSPTS